MNDIVYFLKFITSSIIDCWSCETFVFQPIFIFSWSYQFREWSSKKDNIFYWFHFLKICSGREFVWYFVYGSVLEDILTDIISRTEYFEYSSSLSKKITSSYDKSSGWSTDWCHSLKEMIIESFTIVEPFLRLLIIEIESTYSVIYLLRRFTKNSILS